MHRWRLGLWGALLALMIIGVTSAALASATQDDEIHASVATGKMAGLHSLVTDWLTRPQAAAQQ